MLMTPYKMSPKTPEAAMTDIGLIFLPFTLRNLPATKAIRNIIKALLPTESESFKSVIPADAIIAIITGLIDASMAFTASSPLYL